MLLTQSQYDFLFRNYSKRNADEDTKWPNGVVPYTISGFNNHHIARIKAQINYLNQNLQGCITVRYVKILKCFKYVETNSYKLSISVTKATLELALSVGFR